MFKSSCISSTVYGFLQATKGESYAFALWKPRYQDRRLEPRCNDEYNEYPIHTLEESRG